MGILKSSFIIFIGVLVVAIGCKSYATDLESEMKTTYGLPLVVRDDQTPQPATPPSPPQLREINLNDPTPKEMDFEVDLNLFAKDDSNWRTEQLMNKEHIAKRQFEQLFEPKNCKPRPYSDWNKKNVQKSVCQNWYYKKGVEEDRSNASNLPATNKVWMHYNPEPHPTGTQ